MTLVVPDKGYENGSVSRFAALHQEALDNGGVRVVYTDTVSTTKLVDGEDVICQGCETVIRNLKANVLQAS